MPHLYAHTYIHSSIVIYKAPEVQWWIGEKNANKWWGGSDQLQFWRLKPLLLQSLTDALTTYTRWERVALTLTHRKGRLLQNIYPTQYTANVKALVYTVSINFMCVCMRVHACVRITVSFCFWVKLCIEQWKWESTPYSNLAGLFLHQCMYTYVDIPYALKFSRD